MAQRLHPQGVEVADGQARHEEDRQGPDQEGGKNRSPPSAPVDRAAIAADGTACTTRVTLTTRRMPSRMTMRAFSRLPRPDTRAMAPNQKGKLCSRPKVTVEDLLRGGQAGEEHAEHQRQDEDHQNDAADAQHLAHAAGDGGQPEGAAAGGSAFRPGGSSATTR